VSRNPDRTRSVFVVGALGLVGLARIAAGQPARSEQQAAVQRTRASANERVAETRDVRTSQTDTPISSGRGINAAIDAALAEYRATGVVRVVSLGTVTALPFGRVEPLVTCTLLRACIIELQAGEHLSDAPVAGDAVRWSVDSAKAGPGGQTPLVLVKPRSCDITTNLVVPTDRRIYDLTLDSPPCARGTLNPRQVGVRHVRFYYPDDDRPAPADVSSVRVASVAMPPDNDPLTTLLAQGGRAGRSVNREYRVVRHRRGPFGLFGRKPLDFPWQPASVADDGARTYVVLPASAAPHAAPVFYAVEQDGSRTMVNCAVRTAGGTQVYVADRVVRRAVLVLMNGSHEQRLELENRAWGREAPAARAAVAPSGGAQVGG
jgi:type IV secretion system protein VirB9